MAKVKMNPVLEQFRGKIGDLVFRRFGEDVIVGHKADLSGRPPSAAQATARQRFKLAAVYGHTALADPATKSLYVAKAKAKGQPVFSVAVADFFHAPTIGEIDLSAYTGQRNEAIRIIATDDFDVANVGVRIVDTGGATLEEGPASRNGANDTEWSYQTQTALPAGQAVSIEVTASDRPGNKTTKQQTKS